MAQYSPYTPPSPAPQPSSALPGIPTPSYTAVTLAAGYPYALQLVGDSTWKQTGYPNPGGVLSP
ncbi:MAG: hypothetical protein ACR2P2_18510 [Nakamurella sp.]